MQQMCAYREPGLLRHTTSISQKVHNISDMYLRIWMVFYACFNRWSALSIGKREQQLYLVKSRVCMALLCCMALYQ